MKIFERPMKIVWDYKKDKLKEYSISLGVNTEINEDRFYKNGTDKHGHDKIFCDVIICFPDEFEKLSNEHEESQAKILELESTISKQKESIEKLEDRLSSIDEDHQKEIQKLSDNNNAKVKELNDKIQSQAIENEKTKTKYEKQIGDLKAEHEKELGKLKTAQESHLNGLKLFDEKSHMSIIEHQKEVMELKANEFNSESDMKKEDHWTEINGIKDKISRETIHHNDNINELENSLKFTKYIRGHHKKALEKIREDIQAYLYIADRIESENKNKLQNVKLKEDDE